MTTQSQAPRVRIATRGSQLALSAEQALPVRPTWLSFSRFRVRAEQQPTGGGFGQRLRMRAHVLEQGLVAQDKAGFQQRGANRHVVARLPQALIDGARGVADLLAQIPEQIEDRLDDAFAPRRLLVGQQEQQIDI